jgi:ATP-binding protein involved in chromosome partitioning
MSGRPLIDPKRVPDDVVARQIELVGQYAIRIVWSDGHETGIYNFRRLRKDCRCPECTQKRPQPA